jgi:hypothetical protein
MVSQYHWHDSQKMSGTPDNNENLRTHALWRVKVIRKVGPESNMIPSPCTPKTSLRQYMEKCKHLECTSPTTAHIKAPPPHLLHLQFLSHNKLSTKIENIDKEKAWVQCLVVPKTKIRHYNDSCADNSLLGGKMKNHAYACSVIPIRLHKNQISTKDQIVHE